MENKKSIKELTRDNIWKLKPYSCARHEFKGTASVWLDANESPFNTTHNRYPDPLQTKVKEKIALLKGVNEKQIFLGVGSDECIDLCYRIFCEPKVDNVVAIAPSYGMYEVCADINNVEYRRVPLKDDFSLDTKKLLAACDENTKVIWICSPNNPTGNAFPIEKIKEVYNNFNGILVVDEAYIDFSDKGSLIHELEEMDHLIVLQTFSKAWGSASVRLGIAYANHEIIHLYNKVKYPYNISLLTQKYAIDLLTRVNDVKAWVKLILKNRAALLDDLKQLNCIKQIYPTDANFVLIRVSNADELYNYLKDNGIVIRNRNLVEKCLGCLRITVGTQVENNELIKVMKKYDETNGKA